MGAGQEQGGGGGGGGVLLTVGRSYIVNDITRCIIYITPLPLIVINTTTSWCRAATSSIFTC